jgi:hypothetical protein
LLQYGVPIERIGPCKNQSKSSIAAADRSSRRRASEIQVIERYVQENYEAVMAQDRRILERRKARELPPEVKEAEDRARKKRLEIARQMIRKKLQERNGDQAAG